jgi:alkylhydroperoxidase family enzyme
MRSDRAESFVGRARALTDQVVNGPGKLDAAVRRAAATGHAIEGPAAIYAEKVRRFAYRVTDEDVAALHDAGYSDEQVFELTEAAAHGAALVRLEAALAAIAAMAAGGEEARLS